MKLAVFNGSPRGKRSNSKILIDHFLNGIKTEGPIETETYYLKDTAKTINHYSAFKKAETILFIFPLYTDAMPGIVKHFIEALKDFKDNGSKRIIYIVHSGFPEGIHTSYIERYLEKLTRRLGLVYIGTIRKGGSEGLKEMPKFMTQKLFEAFFNMGKQFMLTGTLDQKILEKLKKPHRFTLPKRLIIQFLRLFGFLDMYWNKKLKENGAYKIRFDRPYES